MSDMDIEAQGDGRTPALGTLAAVSNAMVALHKEQFGRGPVRARSNFAGTDTLVCTLEDSLMPAEHALVDMGQAERVEEARLYFQSATRVRFTDVIEGITGRRVTAFSSAVDPHAAVVWEIFRLAREDGGG